MKVLKENLRNETVKRRIKYRSEVGAYPELCLLRNNWQLVVIIQTKNVHLHFSLFILIDN